MKQDISLTFEAALASPFFTKSPDGIVVVDENGSIVAANRQVLEILGYEAADLVGLPVEILVPEGQRGVHEKHRNAYIANPQPRSMGAGLRLTAVRNDSSHIPVDIALSPFHVGDTTYTIAALRDATARLAAEAAISQADEWRAIIDDRQRIARDLHDTVIQDIFAAGMGLQALQRRIGEDDLREHLGASVSHLDDVITRLRKVIFNLAQGDETEPLDSAARRIVAETVDGAGQEILIDVTVDDGPLPVRTREHVLATLQEALSNAVRHANASQVDVRIEATDSMCRLTVADNGIGIAGPGAARRGFGLTNMMNRAQVLGGSCEITPRPEGGTIVEWTVPL